MQDAVDRCHFIRKPKFPIYAEGTETCFSCGTTLVEIRETQYAPKDGEWRGRCPKCWKHTYFDRKGVASTL